MIVHHQMAVVYFQHCNGKTVYLKISQDRKKIFCKVKQTATNGNGQVSSGNFDRIRQNEND